MSEHAVVGDAAGRRILSPEHLDRLGEAVLALTSELWIMTDRMMVLEAVLQRATQVDIAAEVDAFVPSAAFEAALSKRRDAMIATVVEALKAP